MRAFQGLLPLLLLAGCGGSHSASPHTEATSTHESSSTVVLASEVEWSHLNPARGDKAPQAGTLWGDRNGAGPTGFLLKPADGFRSPPHIHNVSYRGVVIRGLIHNDHPDAPDTWMPAGSYWTQPKGGVHITAAKGGDVLAYIEIEEGPYLVRPVEEAFASEDEQVNVDASKIAWGEQPEMAAAAGGSKVAHLWGNPRDAQPSGALVKLPAAFTGTIRSSGASLRAVVVQGRATYGASADGAGDKPLDPGSYFSSKGELAHRVSCGPKEDCIVYVRTEGMFQVTADQSH